MTRKCVNGAAARRVPALGGGAPPLLRMLPPGATLAAVQATFHRTGRRPVTPRVTVFLVLALLAGATASPARAAGLSVPPSLAELPLTHALQGDEARGEIRRLHGKRIPFEDAMVAHYEGPAGVAMLYVSEARDVVTAQRQVEKMTDRIRNGKGPFTHLRERVHDGATVFSFLGQGQVHYCFRQSARVVWVAADAMVARRALADALRHFR